eukprot:jgi/Tetstr1/423859/TSEL_014483.t1
MGPGPPRFQTPRPTTHPAQARIATKTDTMAAKAPPAHPKYEVMIAEAIKALKDRTGSSTPAIAKYIEGAYGKDLPANWKKVLAVQLKRLAESGKLVKIKASFKLGEALKNPPKPAKKPVKKKAVVKKPAVKKTVAKKPAAKKTPAKKPAVKKTAAKKTPTKKAPAKKPAAKKAAPKK